jgi:phosphoribosylanthranilate isomerase
LKQELPAIRLVQVIHVYGEESITEAKNAAQFVDALLLDSGNQKLKVKELGGTGRTHDWTISRKIRNAVSVPVYLAGGINANNVLDAAKEVEPFGIDLCSGVRENGKLNEERLEEFFSVFNTDDR